MGAKHCKNRAVVTAGGGRYSPYYDFEGDDGAAWYEFTSISGGGDAMCDWSCNASEYNAWVDAADEYINGNAITQLKGHYNEVRDHATAVYGGAAIPSKISLNLDPAKSAIDRWDDMGLSSGMTWRDDLRHISAWYWADKIIKIVEVFDEAACAYDNLNDAARDLGTEELVRIKEIEAGSEWNPTKWLGGEGSPPSRNSDNGMGTAKVVSTVALGFGVAMLAFGGYKVLKG